MKTFLLFLFMFVSALYSSAQTDLFFSEYVEGAGNNKALEIYNPTSQTIDLNNYYILRYSNGALTYAAGGITHLKGTLAPYKTFVLVNGQTVSDATSPACSPVLQAYALLPNNGQLDGAYPAPTYMNGNDAIALIKTPGGAAPTANMSNVTSVDLFGQVGLGSAISAETGWSNVKDTVVSYKSNGVTVSGKVINYIVQAKSTDGSTFGPYWMAWTANHSLVRKATVINGVKNNPNPFVVIKEWDTIPAVVDTAGHLVYEDIWTNLGKHACVADPLYTSVNKTSAASSSLTLYPNPVTADRFTIISQPGISEVEIFSAIGQSVYKQVGRKGQQQVEIGSLGLGKGVYFVKVTSLNNTSAVKKILIK
jgi:hypothetical protein